MTEVKVRVFIRILYNNFTHIQNNILFILIMRTRLYFLQKFDDKYLIKLIIDQTKQAKDIK